MTFSQTKTPQGYLPFRAVSLMMPGSGNEAAHIDEPSFAFDVYTACEMVDARKRGIEIPTAPQGVCDLATLGLCVKATARGFTPSEDSLSAFAAENGPLFGAIDGIESLRAWKYAADAAMTATRIQECVNGSKDIRALRAMGRVSKQRLADVVTGAAFEIFTLHINPYGVYREAIARLPFIHRVECEEGIAYVFVSWVSGEHGADELVEFDALLFPGEITEGDVQTVSMLLGFDAELERLSWERLVVANREDSDGTRAPTSAQGADEVFGAGGSVIERGSIEQIAFHPFEAEDAPLDAADAPVLAALVQAMIAAHLGGAIIDVFQGDAVTGYLAFDSLVSWLWYDFSRALSKISVGYCERCGKPFSLTGHRGVGRRYCSRACKTEAKNARMRQQRNDSRNLFLAGASLETIAREVYAGTRERDAVQRIRGDLSKWVELKRRLDESIAQEGFSASQLFRRCVSAGLDMHKLLNAQRWDELQRGLRRASHA